MNKKHCMRAFGAVLLIAICAVVFYFRTYPIQLDLAKLDWQTIGEVKREGEPEPDVEFLGKGLIIDRKGWYLISVDGKFGYASFERGPLGRYRLRTVGYGDGSFANGIIESQGKKYLLFSGLDPREAIDKITVEVQGFTYDLFTREFSSVLPTSPILISCEVDPNIQAQNVNLFDITFYDAAGNDITSDYELSGGRIQ